MSKPNWDEAPEGATHWCDESDTDYACSGFAGIKTDRGTSCCRVMTHGLWPSWTTTP